MAHVMRFREEFVRRRGWLEAARFDALFSLCQFLPGPSSSQLGMALGLERGGLCGLGAAWLGFTLPSAVAMGCLSLALTALPARAAGAVHGLKLLALAILLQAAWGMGRSLCPDRERQTVAILALVSNLFLPTSWGLLVTLLLGAGWGLGWAPRADVEPGGDARPFSGDGWSRVGVVALLILCLALLCRMAGERIEEIFLETFKAGGLVFGGGHVVLPLLQERILGRGWMSGDVFLAGYGLAQAMPGPLFSFSAYLGMLRGGIAGALAGLLGIFAPGALLLMMVLPWWERLRGSERAQGVVAGIGAASVGLLLQVVYSPGWSLGVRASSDFALLALALLLLTAWKVPTWALVPLLAGGGWIAGT